MQRLNSKILKAVLSLETILAGLVIISVIIGSVEIVQYIKNILSAKPPEIYTQFRDLLGFILLLVIGLELSLMLIRHTPGSVIEVMLFAIARKLLIYTTETYEFLIGVIALAGIFAIRRFLFVSKISEIDGITLSAATPIKDANRIIGCNIPEGAAKTLGGIIVNLAEDSGEDIEANKNFPIADVNLSVIAMVGGVIEKVKVERLDPIQK